MKIGIITQDNDLKQDIKDYNSIFNHCKYKIICFDEVPEINKININNLAIILVDTTLLRTQEDIDSLCKYTEDSKSEIYLIYNSINEITNLKIPDSYVTGMVHKNIKTILNKIQYIESKIRINTIVDFESAKISNIAFCTRYRF